MLDPTRTVLEEGLDTPQRVTEQFVRTLLGSFLFRGDDVFKKVSVLSGGEKSRLALVKLLLDPPNLLLMDEPTTHLDMSSIDALLYALDQFEGTLIFISHDVYFIRALADHVAHVDAGRLTIYPGDYQYYLDKTNAGSARAALTAGSGTRTGTGTSSEEADDGAGQTCGRPEGATTVRSGTTTGPVQSPERPTASRAHSGEENSGVGRAADGVDGGARETGNL
jgi:ATP-binding cassette subfamily F protein 3